MLSEVSSYIENLIVSMGVFAPIVSCLLILFESILPMLPLCIFITINFIFFGHVWGFLISWIFTCLGCYLSYFLVLKGFGKWSRNKTNVAIFDKMIMYVKHLDIPALAAIISCPFTPAFAVNIASGLCEIDFKKFAISILVGKIFMVYFWGFIGAGLVESFSNPVILIKVLIMILVAYLASIIINKIIKEKTE